MSGLAVCWTPSPGHSNQDNPIAFSCLAGIMLAVRKLPEPELVWYIRTKSKACISAHFAETQTPDRIPVIFLPWKGLDLQP